MLKTLANGSQSGRAKTSVSGPRAGLVATMLLDGPSAAGERPANSQRLATGRRIATVGQDGDKVRGRAERHEPHPR